jgi:hypothetical protein
MIEAIKKSPPQSISKHSADPTIIQAVDISPSRVSPTNKSESLRTILLQAKADGILKAFLGPSPKGPGSDPAYHIEVWQNEKAPTGFATASFKNNAPPTVSFVMLNTNLKKSSTWTNPILKDHNDEVNNASGKSGQA